MKKNSKGVGNGKQIAISLALCSLFICSGQVFAESPKTQSNGGTAISMQIAKIKVSGIVVDKSGEPVAGASVVEKGTRNGVSTDANGKFKITVKIGAELQISMIGFVTSNLKASDNMRVVLKENRQLLDEVVLVGYGSQKKVNLTGAVANINVKEALESRPVTDVGKALQGISPGLTITNRNGGIGNEPKIRLRGSVGSLNSSTGTQPLILVDNVEVPSLNLVNPDDVETISILKDAASASIYGTRAAWGVILITTKQGKKNEKPTLTYSNNFAWTTPTKMAVQASAVDNARFSLAVMKRLGLSEKSNIGYNINEHLVDKLIEWNEKYGKMSQSELGELKEGRDFEIIGGKPFFYRSFDPISEFTRKWTPQQTHNISISGGSRKTTYNISLGYLNQKGVMRYHTDDYKRYNVTSNINVNIKDWWKFRTNIMFTRSTNTQPYKYTSGKADAWVYLLRWPRWYPYADYKGKPFRSAVTDIKYANNETVNDNYIRANLGSEFTPIKNLFINIDYTFAMYNVARKRNGGTIMAYDMFTTNPFNNYSNIYGKVDDRVVQASSYRFSNIFKAYATYDFALNEAHNFKIMAGMDAESRDALGHYSERRQLISSLYPEIALATGDQFSSKAPFTFHNNFASAGFFARLNYNYMQKYLLELNARYDGSSLFPEGRKWAFFPSMSLGWRLSQESFMQWAKPVLSNLKLRGSWGTIGSQNVDSYSYLSTMSVLNSNWVVNDVNVPYVTSPTTISPTLTWERVSTLDLGVDARFFDNRLGFTMDWYKRVTSGMHTAGQQLPATFGAEPPKINYGELTATGLELSMDYKQLFANGLGINFGATFSYGKEVITKFNKSDKNIYGNYQGKVLGEIWGYETDRLFQESDFEKNAEGRLVMKEGIPSQSLYEKDEFMFGPGDVKYKDLDGDGKITYGKNTIDDHGDLRVIGNSLPNYEYSFNFGMNYKGFDFSVIFQGVGKKDYWAYGAIGIPSGSASYADAVYEHQMDYWTPERTNAFYPRPYNMAWKSNDYNFLRQTRFLCNMAYLRCKNLTLGYSIPAKLLRKIYVSNARFYVSAENLFEFDHMRIPVDPEATAYKPGVKVDTWAFGRAYPIVRTLSFGMQISF